jgi:EmrB/QacA subfamily drug resistance transporter
MNVAGTRRWWALGALAVSGLVVGLDLTILNIALPTLARDLHASTGDLQWFANAYNLVLAAVLLPAGLLGDRFGRKKLLFAALALFGLASLGCAYATSVNMLIATRALLGLGAAFVIPLAMAVLPVLFPDRGERQRALTVWITANFIGFPLGPIVGGLLLDTYWWGSVFLINVPVVALALVAVALLLPESRSSQRPRLDLVGLATSSVGLVALTYGVIRAGERGWGDPGVVMMLAAGLVVLTAFGLWQRRLTRQPDGQPLVDLALFGSAGFTWGAILATMVTFAIFGLMFTMPQYFQAVAGTNSLGTGLRLLPMIGGLLVGSRIGDRLTPRAGAKVTVTMGFVLIAIGLAIGATTGAGTGYGFIAGWLALVGAGLGFAIPAAMGAALGALSAERSGVGSALIQALRQVGGAIGVAILGAVLGAVYRGRLDLSGVPAPVADPVRRSVSGGVAVAHRLESVTLLDSVRAAFVHGMDTMLWVCAGIAVFGAVLAVVFMPGRAEPVEAERTDPAQPQRTVGV